MDVKLKTGETVKIIVRKNARNVRILFRGSKDRCLCSK